MKTFKRGITILILFITAISCSQKPSLEWTHFIWQSDTISGKYIEKAYLYVPVRIDDIPQDFTMQLDLGTFYTQFYGNAIAPYLEENILLASKLDSNGWFTNVNLHMSGIEFNGVNIAHRMNFGEEIPKDSLYSKTPQHIGTIAPDMFQDKIVVIDYKSGKLAFTDSLPDEYKDLSVEKFDLVDGIIKLPFHINGKEYMVMFDTGASPFELVTTKERALEIANPDIVDSISGPLWWGTEITINGYEVNKPIQFGVKDHKGSRVYYVEDGLWDDIYESMDVWGITGNAFFYNNTVIIDYENKLFRVK